MINTLFAFYGDDFTGSTDVMEALAGNGLETVLFLKEPDEELLLRFQHVGAIGLAGTSRSESPEWMDEHLTHAFKWLKAQGAALTHYKVCSTFDSSPEIGNIGRAIEIGKQVFESTLVPLVVGAPEIRRYTAFGQLFAAYQGKNYRIDRHPVMSHHPVTPMHEADLLIHLSRQTKLSSALLDCVALNDRDVAGKLEGVLETKPEILLLDVLDVATQSAAGQLLWHALRPQSPFVCGSSGVEYALIRALRQAGEVGEKPRFTDAGPVAQISVVSGSVSPTTERQIRHALSNGFEGVALDPLVLSGEGAQTEIERAGKAGLEILERGASPLLYTALGSSSDRGREIDTGEGGRHRIGRALGQIQKRLVSEGKLTRAVVAGGDTSSHALGEMGIAALTLKMPLPQTPGSPLCVAHGGPLDGLEISLKGGQVGGDDYFSMIRGGRQ